MAGNPAAVSTMWLDPPYEPLQTNIRTLEAAIEVACSRGAGLQTNLATVEAAIDVARAQDAILIWQQSFGNRGRAALADPVRLLNGCRATADRFYFALMNC